MELSSKQSGKLPLILALLALILLGSGSLYLTWQNLQKMQNTVFEHMLLSVRSIASGLDIQLVNGMRRLQRNGLPPEVARDRFLPVARELFREIVAQGDLIYIGLYGPDNKPLIIAGKNEKSAVFQPPADFFEQINIFGEASSPALIDGKAVMLFGRLGQPLLLQLYNQRWRDRMPPPPRKENYLIVGLNAEKHLAQFGQYRRAALIQTGYVFLAGFVLWLLAVAYFRRREQDTRLAKLEKFQANLLDNMPDGLLIASNTNTILAANGSAHDLLIQEEGETLVGKEWSSLGLKSGKDFKQGNIRWEHVKVSNKNLEFQFFPYNEGPDEQKTMILVRDRTDIAELEDDLNEARRLASIGSLAAGVAHEIRNPLSSLRGFAQLFAEKLKNEKPFGEYATTMLEEADRLNRVVTDLLFLSRPRELHPEQIEINGLCESILTLIGFDLEHKGAKLETDIQADSVFADPDGIRQVLLNLLMNSLDAIPEGTGVITISSRNDKNGVWISVTDNGPGMPENIIKHALEPFFTDKPKGTGLGLSIVNTIIRGHRGRVRISSGSENGTVIDLFFPLPDEQE
ncbi:two-component system sensor histidine kinase NtrB [Maridesulfovibrio bastinii]|uniref:two-component system sensor histidine kinase NtrB n=1 Tax=Maridesulfovibrio bastinii TaxID=47157 RepID=UPI0003FC2E75|nr:ATP-binding protein [Maridesulfovibrio bastinii]